MLCSKCRKENSVARGIKKCSTPECNICTDADYSYCEECADKLGVCEKCGKHIPLEYELSHIFHNVTNKQATEILNKLGVPSHNEDGTMRPLEDILNDISKRW